MSLTDDQVLQQIRTELAAIKVPDAESATPESTWSQLDVDSLDLVELVKSLEDAYAISISDGELEPIESVGDAIGLVQRLVAAKEGAPA